MDFPATKESGILLRDGNRRARQWRRPPAHVAGTFRGPTIVAPHTSYGSHLLLPAELQKNVRWFPAPSPGHGVEFTLYVHDAREGASWGSEQFVLAETVLRGGLRVVVLACERPMPGSFSATVEELRRTSVLRYEDVCDHLGGSLLWISESADALRMPFIVDMPAPVAENSSPQYGHRHRRNRLR